MPDTVHLIPVAEIDAAALDRDRTSLDEAALAELRLSIATHGLRMPVEVYAFAAPDPGSPHRYGLISGFRRLAAVRALAGTFHDRTRFAAIPAFLRTPRDAADAYRQMVEENAIRAELSPWEQAMVAVRSARAAAHPGIDAAIDDLYANLSRQKRARLRTIAHLADDLDGFLTAPETLSLRQLLRLAPLIPRGYGDLLRATLADTPDDPEAEWTALLPILAEAERPEPETAAPRRPGRPRRTLDLGSRGIRIRRERTRTGWALHFSGRYADSDTLDRVFDEIERLFSPPEPREPSKHLPPAHRRR